MSDLQSLLERVKAATGPDREFDHAIAFATQFRPDARHDPIGSFAHHEAKHDYATAWIAHAPWREQWAIPQYTASIDAALALVERMLPGWTWCVDSSDRVKGNEDGWYWASVITPDPYKYTFERGTAPTPALAILTALLTALIAQAKGGDHGG